MNNQSFSEWIEAFGQRVRTMRGNVNLNHVPHKAGPPVSLYEMQAVQEELSAAEEELRLQNEELRAACERAEAERRRYQELFEFAHDGYIISDVKGVVVEANQAAGRLFNIAPQFLTGKPLIRFLAPESHDIFRTELRQAQQTQKSSGMTVRVLPRASASFFASITLSAINSDTGHVTGIRWLLRNVTEQLSAHRELQTLLEETQRQLRERKA